MKVDIKKISIIGLRSDRGKILKETQRMGNVQLEEFPMTPEERADVLEVAEFYDPSQRLTQLDSELALVKQALTFLSSYDKRPKSPKRRMTYGDFSRPNNFKREWEKVFSANILCNQIAEAKADINGVENEILALRPWKKLEEDVDFSGTNTTSFFRGTLPIRASIELAYESLPDVNEFIFDIIDEDDEQKYATLLVHKEFEKETLEAFEQLGFHRTEFAGLRGTITQNIAKFEEKIGRIRANLNELEEKAAKSASTDIEYAEKLYDNLNCIKDRRAARAKILKTESTFFVSGWIPAKQFKKYKIKIESRYEAIIDEIPISDDEAAPVLLKNSPGVSPFEMITSMFSLPGKGDIDPNFFMALFYFFFFGIMLGDAAYGIIMSVLCFIILIVMKPEGGMKKTLQIFTICGFSGLIWGAMFGGWFGDLFPIIRGAQETRQWYDPIWFNPLDDPMLFLVWSFIFGAVHILAGMAIKAYMLIRDGDIWGAIFDVGLWYLMFAGIGMLAFGLPFAMAVTLVAVVGLVLTQARDEKNIIKRLGKGLVSLYGITGYFADILSYSRLLALSLASAVVATVINTLGTMMGVDNIGGIILLIVASLLGHTLNLALGVLGAYVHASRLQYVEFFGKFYDGGGVAFKPLNVNNKYISLKD